MISAIDGFNLIYKMDDLAEYMYTGDLPLALQGLSRRLNEYSEGVQQKKIHNPRLPRQFIVFFDGKKEHGASTKREQQRNIEIRYSLELSADHLIKDYVRKHPNPKAITLITSDKQILKETKIYGVTQIKSEDAAQIINQALAAMEIPPPEEEKPAGKLSPEEVEYWAQIFEKKK